MINKYIMSSIVAAFLFSNNLSAQETNNRFYLDENSNIKKIDFKKIKAIEDLNIVNTKELELVINRVHSNENIKTSLKELIQKVIPSNKKILSLKEELKQARIDLDNANNNRLPTLDYTAKYSMDQVSKNTWNKSDSEAPYILGNDTKDTFNEVGQFKQGLYMNMDLYKGGSLTLERKIAKNSILFLENKIKKEIESEIKKIIDIYLELLFIIEKKDISLTLLKTLEDFMINTNSKYEAGLIAKGDLNAIKALYYEQKSAYINFASEQYQKESLYDFLIGKDLKHLRPKELSVLYNIDSFDKLKENLFNNLDIKNNQIKLNKLRLDNELSKSNFKPNLKVALNYTDLTRFPTNFLESDKDRTKTINGMVEFSYPLFNKGRDMNEYKKTIISLRKNKFDLTYLQENLEYTLKKSFLTVDSLKRNISNYEIQLKNIKEMLTNYYDLYNGGQNLVKKILDGEKNKNRVENKIIENNETYYKEYYKIKQLTGSLLEEFDINIDNLYNEEQYSSKEINNDNITQDFLDMLSDNLKLHKIINKISDKDFKEKQKKKQEQNQKQTEITIDKKTIVNIENINNSKMDILNQLKDLKKENILTPINNIDIIKKELDRLKVKDENNSLTKKSIQEEINITKKELNLSKKEILEQLNLYKK